MGLGGVFSWDADLDAGMTLSSFMNYNARVADCDDFQVPVCQGQAI